MKTLTLFQCVAYSVKCGWTCAKTAWDALKKAQVGDHIEVYFKIDIGEDK